MLLLCLLSIQLLCGGTRIHLGLLRKGIRRCIIMLLPCRMDNHVPPQWVLYGRNPSCYV